MQKGGRIEPAWCRVCSFGSIDLKTTEHRQVRFDQCLRHQIPGRNGQWLPDKTAPCFFFELASW